MTFVAGAFNATWDQFDATVPAKLGTIEDGFELDYTGGGDPITGDNLGDTIQNYVMRGGNMYLNLTLQEFDTAEASQIFWNHSTSATPTAGQSLDLQTFGHIGEIGVLGGWLARRLVLTKIYANTTTPYDIWTFYLAVVAMDVNLVTRLASRLRNIPIRMQILPYDSATNPGTDPPVPVFFDRSMSA